jgi:hypothetical protein
MSAPRSLDEARRDGWATGIECDFLGHSWMDAGGGLEFCGLCEAERWAPDDDEQPVEIVSGKLRERYRSVA